MVNDTEWEAPHVLEARLASGGKKTSAGELFKMTFWAAWYLREKLMLYYILGGMLFTAATATMGFDYNRFSKCNIQCTPVSPIPDQLNLIMCKNICIADWAIPIQIMFALGTFGAFWMHVYYMMEITRGINMFSLAYYHALDSYQNTSPCRRIDIFTAAITTIGVGLYLVTLLDFGRLVSVNPYAVVVFFFNCIVAMWVILKPFLWTQKLVDINAFSRLPSFKICHEAFSAPKDIMQHALDAVSLPEDVFNYLDKMPLRIQDTPIYCRLDRHVFVSIANEGHQERERLRKAFLVDFKDVQPA